MLSGLAHLLMSYIWNTHWLMLACKTVPYFLSVTPECACAFPHNVHDSMCNLLLQIKAGPFSVLAVLG